MTDFFTGKQTMKTLFYILIFAAMAALILFIIFLLLIKPSMRRHRILQRCLGRQFAHRGLHDAASGIPENTLVAYSRAVEKGFGIELDVRLTADEIPVIMHDPNTLRMTGEEHDIAQCELEALKTLRLKGTDQRIPTLAEALELVNGRVPLIVELKVCGNNFELLGTKTFELLDSYNGDYMIECFDPRMLSWVRKHRPRTVRGQLIMHFRRHGDEVLSPVVDWVTHNLLLNVIARPDFISIFYPDRQSLPLKLCRMLGVKELDWTVKTQDELDVCRSDGVDSCIFEGFIPRE